MWTETMTTLYKNTILWPQQDDVNVNYNSKHDMARQVIWLFSLHHGTTNYIIKENWKIFKQKNVIYKKNNLLSLGDLLMG